MAKFCGEGCAAVCDFCIHYKDELRDIQKRKDEFYGEGICDIDNHETDASGGYNCDNFHCFMIDKNNNTINDKRED